MRLDKFINRPVLSTVISILLVILGIIGLATLPITQTCHTAYYPISGHRASYRFGERDLYGRQCASRIELCDFSVGGPDQWCGKHDVHAVYRY